MDWWPSGPAERVPTRPVRTISEIRGHRHGQSTARILTDEDVRAIRWWSQTTGMGLPITQQARTLAQWYPVRPETLADVVCGQSFPHVVGLPLTARYWRRPEDQRLGLLYWLVWLVWTLRTYGMSMKQGLH